MATATAIDISPQVVNLTFRQGTDVDQSILKMTWKAGGVAVDLENWTARAGFATKIGETPLFSLTTAGGGIVLNEVHGQIELKPSALQTNSISPTLFKQGKLIGVWDVDMISPTGKVRPFVAGVWTLNQDIKHV
jgi:hypothetical protein